MSLPVKNIASLSYLSRAEGGIFATPFRREVNVIVPHRSLIHFSFRCKLRQAPGGLHHSSPRSEGPPSRLEMQLRFGGRQFVLGEVVFQSEGVLQIHPFR